MSVLVSQALEWRVEYYLGLPELDVQHKQLFDAIWSLCADRPAPVERDRLAELARLTRVHFAYESILMDAYDFPDAPEHAAEHRGLEAQLSDEVARLLAGRQGRADLGQFLNHWLVDHILGTDRVLAAHVRAVRDAAD